MDTLRLYFKEFAELSIGCIGVLIYSLPYAVAFAFTAEALVRSFG